MIKISVIVPTYNRSEYLPKSLPSFFEQSISPDFYEILIIDNNSTDNTAGVIKDIIKTSKCQCRYIFEPRIGLHHARNRGLLEAEGEIVIFGDDDILATPTWLEGFMDEFVNHQVTGIAGGKIKPIWEQPPEEWIYDYGNKKMHGVFAYLDYGEQRLILNHDYVYGNNFGVRKNLAIQTGGSYPDTFPRKLKYLSGIGEYALIDNVRNLNYDIVYLPNTLVFHHVDPSRITLKYFIERHQRWAIERTFDVFRRKRDKYGAAVELIEIATNRLKNAKINSVGKINPNYYLKIQKSASVEMIKQTVRVLLDESLYEHITKENYLEN